MRTHAALVAATLLVGCKSTPADTGPCAAAALPAIDLDAFAGLRQEVGRYTVPWDTATERELDLHIWYPTADTSGEEAEYIGLFDDSHSLVDASYAEADSQCTHPLVVYSHGSQAWAGGGSPLIRQFVKEGWVAIGADHLGNTLNNNWDPRPKDFNLLRTADVRFAIDYLEDLPEDDPLHGRVDTSRVLVFGHSYGGQTSWLMSGPTLDPTAIATYCDGQCTAAMEQAYVDFAGDERVVGTAPMAGNLNEDMAAASGFADIDVPVFYMTGSDDFDGQPHYDRAAQTPDLTWVELEGACHESFTATELPCDGIPKEDSLTIVGTYLTAFGTRVVLDAEDAAIDGILDGTTEVDARATLTR